LASKFLLGSDYITNDVTKVNQDKRQGDNKNYNSGRVKLKCYVNRYCPILKGQHVNYGLLFNGSTVASISEAVAKNFDFVPGIDGMFLKQKFNYRSTFLAHPVNLNDAETIYESASQSPSSVSRVNTTGSVDISSHWQPTLANSGKLNRIEKYLEEVFDTIPDYIDHQTWVVVPSPVDNKKIPEESQYLCYGPCPRSQSAARWKYIALPRDTENDGVNATNNSPPNERIGNITAESVITAGPVTVTGPVTVANAGMLGGGGESQGLGPFKPSSESADSYVLFPSQMAAAPVKFKASDSSANTSTVQEGIHWRVKKQTPLFKGEDFFIEFRNISIEKDPQNITSKAFIGDGYDFLDVHTDGNYSGSIVNGQYTGKWPVNGAVVTYKSVVDEISTETNAPATVTVTRSFTKVKESVKDFDFHKQPYLILEMKGSNGHYFLVFAEKSFPICFKAVDISDDAADIAGEGSSSKISILLSKYKNISCRSLFKETGFTMSVRNHLGKIVVTFLGAEGSPWIIEDTAGQTINEDNIFRVPDQCELYLWGGNYATAFSFNPLQYNNSADISLPPKTGSKDGSNSDSSVFTVSDFGIGSHHIVLSSSDIVPDKYRTTGTYKRVRYSVTGTSDSAGEDLYVGSRTPFYTCDAHWLTEIGFKRGDNTPISYDSGFDKDIPCTFTNTGDYIKDSNEIAGESVGHLEEPSSITIEAKAVQGTLDGMDSNLGVASQELEQNNQNAKHFAITASLVAGSYVFEGGSDIKEWTLNDCITPVITNLRLVSVPLEEGSWTPDEEGIDVSAHVTKFTDSWTSQDFYTAEHSGNISFIVSNEGGDETLSHSEELEEMKDKAFYIEVWAGYNDCSYTFGPVDEDEGGLFYKLFTGICFGGTIIQEPMIRKMECKIVDYSKILKDTLFFNSPFFDGMRDANAVYEILKIASFKEISKGSGGNDGDGIFGACDPASEISLSCDSRGGYSSVTADGREYVYSEYALPFSYDRIQNPFFRFKDGSNLYEALVGFAKRGAKMMFFDAFGVFHYQDSMGIKMSTLTNSQLDKYVKWRFRTGNPDFKNSGYQLVFNSMSKIGAVEDVYNNIHTMTSTPNFEVIIGDRVNWASVTDPSVKGFLGYKRTMLQVESTFGNEEALKNIMDYYKAVWVPPLVYSFETYGQPLRIFDVISIDDNNILVTGVSSDIDPQANKWGQTIEGEWFGVSTTVTTTGETLGLDPGGELNLTGGGTGSITFRGQTYVHSNGTTKAVM